MLSKKISLGMSYVLYLQYAEMYQLYQNLENKLTDLRNVTINNMQQGLAEYIKQGYISESQQYYSASLNWDKEVLTINGHQVKLN